MKSRKMFVVALTGLIVGACGYEMGKEIDESARALTPRQLHAEAEYDKGGGGGIGGMLGGNAPSVATLQKAITDKGGWENGAEDVVIILLNGGGECTCELRDPESGKCQLYVCGNQDASWGSVLVPRPASPGAARAQQETMQNLQENVEM